ncbi:MAG: helix-turn-helix domain-containing protein [Burkholderiaceae bacterium]|nr:helix-turn-helix domain-containing protein [Burkholderiaceae bacterium]
MFHTVDDAARLLRLHPKTVLRFIREGRLHATRVGKAYRILPADLAALAPVPPSAPAPVARATTVVDIAPATPALHRHLSRSLLALASGRPAPGQPLQLDAAFDPATDRLKLIVTASPADTATLLSALETLLAQAQDGN